MSRLQNQSPGFHREAQFDIIVDLYDKSQEKYYTRFTNVKQTRNATVKAATIGNMAPAPIVNEGDPIVPQDFTTPYYNEYTPRNRATGFGVSKQATLTAKNGLLADRGPMLTRSIINSEEQHFHNMALNLATSSSFQTPDGLPLASAAHLCANGTYSNIITGNAPLSYEALALIEQLFMETEDHEGNPMSMSGKKALLVPPALKDLAYRLVETPGIAGTNDKDINYSGRDFVVVCSPFFNASSTAYAAVMLDPMWNPLLEFVQMPLSTDSEEVKNRLMTMYYIHKAWVAVPKDGRGYLYSSG